MQPLISLRGTKLEERNWTESRLKVEKMFEGKQKKQKKQIERSV
jgi:hypothetical protein